MSGTSRNATATRRPSQRAHAREFEVQAARIAAPRLWLIAAVCALVALGIVMVYSASSIKALTTEGNAQAELVSQLVFIVGGIVVAVAAARLFNYHVLLEKSIYLVGAAIVLLGVVRLTGVASHGATRWISVLGVSLQPSEFAKICIVLGLAQMMSTVKRGTRLHDQSAQIMGAACLLALVLIFFQPDKGTVMVCAVAFWVMLAVDGTEPKKLIALAVGFLLAYLAYAYLKDDYSRQRIVSSFDPFADEYGDGYQSVHGFFAFASGGLFGRGLGMGVQKYAYLPEAHNDFILPVIGEELGLVGVIGVFACFGIIGWAGVRIAEQANDRAGRLLAIGCVGLLLGQAMLNFAGVLGVAPLTGKAVPFLSAGGSSMLASMLIVGLLANVSLNTTLPKTVHDRRRAKLAIARDEEQGSRGKERPVAPAGLTLINGGYAATAAPRRRSAQGTALARHGAPTRNAGSAHPELRDVSRPARRGRQALKQGA